MPTSSFFDYSKGAAPGSFIGATGLGKTDWGSMPGKDSFGGGSFGVDTAGKFGSGPKPFGSSGSGDWSKGAQFLGRFLSKMGGSDEDKYRSQAEQFGARPLGYPMGGSGGQILDNLGVVFPQQHAPLYIPGVVDAGGKTTGQRIAGAAGGALQGFMSGAATGMPHMAGIGAIVGGLTGGFG